MNITNIYTFDKIIIKPNTLIICDIDETILKFDNINEKWWQETFNNYYLKSKNYDYAEAKTLETWTQYIKSNNPKATDYKGLSNLFDKIEQTQSKLIFVTARENNLTNITKNHFDCINISNFDYSIYYIGEIPKGEFIKSNIQTDTFTHIIFIDDLLSNLESVYENFGNSIILYKFQYT